MKYHDSPGNPPALEYEIVIDPGTPPPLKIKPENPSTLKKGSEDSLSFDDNPGFPPPL